MKFAVLKALPKSGILTTDWKVYIQKVFRNKPEDVRQDYEKLVRAIADLELMEKYLREEVLHLDEETSSLRDAIDRAVQIGALFAPVIGLFDRKHGVDIEKVLGDVENVVAAIPGIGRAATLSGLPTGLQQKSAKSLVKFDKAPADTASLF